MVSKAQQKAVNKYVKQNYDRVNVTMPTAKRKTAEFPRRLKFIYFLSLLLHARHLRMDLHTFLPLMHNHIFLL